MSVNAEGWSLHLSCDDPAHNTALGSSLGDFYGITKREAWKDARRCGWMTNGDKHYCPHCVARVLK